MEQQVYAQDPASKLARGITNIATSPLEYLVQYYESEGNYQNPLATAFSLIFGVPVKGTMDMAVRLLAGVYDTVTFPIPLPHRYDPWLRPETVFDAIREVQ